MKKLLTVYSLIIASFHPLLTHASDNSLLDIYENAVVNDPSLLAAQAAVATAKAKNRQAKGGLYPSIVLTGEAARNKEDVKTKGIGSTGEFDYNSHNYQLILNQPLYNKAAWSNLEAEKTKVLAAETKYKAAQQATTLEVLNRYFEVLSAQQELSFAKAEKSATQEQLKVSQKRYDTGFVIISDVHTAKTSYDLAIVNEIEASDRIDDAHNALQEITDSTTHNLSGLKADFIAPPVQPENLSDWLETLDRGNLELLLSRHKIQAIRAEIKKSRAAYHPSLDLVARVGNEQTGGRFGDSQIDNQTIALELEIPLYQGGKNSARVREMRSRLDQALYELQKVSRSLAREIKSSYRSVSTAKMRISAQTQAVTSATAALQSVKSSYKAGTGTSADVLEAQKELFKAKRDLSASRHTYIINLAQLKKLSGELGKRDIQMIDSWLQPPTLQ